MHASCTHAMAAASTVKATNLQDQDYANVTCHMRVPWFVLIIPKHVNSSLNDAHPQLDLDFLPIQDLV